MEDEGWERGESGIGTLRRGQSRGQSRRGSTSTGGGWGDGTRDDPEEIEEEIVPDFVNAEEEEEEEEEGEEDVDEGEMKRVVLGRVGGWIDWAVGWMDFRGEEDEDEEEEDDRGASENGGAAMDGIDGGDIVKGELDPIELQKRLRRKKKWDAEAEVGGEGKMDVSSAPEQAGWWTDARWLVGVASKVAL